MIIIDKIEEKAIREIYRASLIDRIQKKIEQCLKKSGQKSADRIVAEFLSRHFVDNQNIVSQIAIEEYLFSRDLDAIVLSFWRCVVDIWARKEKMLKPSDATVEKLSRWNSIQERALEEPDAQRRRKLVGEVITRETLPFFANITMDDFNGDAGSKAVFGDDDIFKTVKFKYFRDLENVTKGGKTSDNGALRILSKIFNYGWMTEKNYLRHKVLSVMNIPVCPYCNRQYITRYREEQEDRITADLDHYYYKSQYPYLALSVYNFVPSCQVCNSRFKLARDFYGTPHLYPYEKNPTSGMRFTIANAHMLMDEEAWKDMNAPVVKIRTTGEAAANSVRTFHLDEVYQSHGDYVQEIIWKAKIYGADRIAGLLDEFPDVFANKQKVRELVFGQYLEEDEAHKRPLAKLAQDILAEMEMLEQAAI